MLEETYKSYRELADQINWKKYSINDLFYEYINHKDDKLSENFYAAIVCRVWGYAGRLYVQCNKHVPFEQCYDTLIDTINYVLEKRVWENEKSSLYGDKAAPDKAFHIVLKRQRSILLANLNAQKRKSNFNTLSIDSIHSDYGDSAEGLFNITDTSENEDITLREFIKQYYKNGDMLSTVILDAICYQTDFNEKSIARYIKKLDHKDYKYYNDYYDIEEKDFLRFCMKMKRMPSKNIISEIKKLLYILKGDFSSAQA